MRRKNKIYKQWKKKHLPARKTEDDSRRILAVLGIALIALTTVMIYIKPEITGFITAAEEFNFTDVLNITFEQNSSYNWKQNNHGNLSGIRLSGKFSGKGSARAFIENENITYLIFENDKKEEMAGITTFISEYYNIETPLTSAAENTSSNKTIFAILNYKGDTEYDADNDGIEPELGIIDFDLSASFEGDTDYSKLCSRWEIYSLENEESTVFCNGNSECCDLMNLVPSKPEWNSSLYLTYGLHGATKNNIVSSQVIFAHYNLSAENPVAEFAYSNWSKLTAVFYDEAVEFTDACIETCALVGFDTGNYNLIIEVNNGSLHIDKISYTVIAAVENRKPVQTIVFPNITLKEDKVAINLGDYFSDPDNDALSYSFYPSHIGLVKIINNIAEISADDNLDETIYGYFIANDSEQIAISNIFSIGKSKKKILLPEEFIVKDNSGNILASIDSKGNIYLKGRLFESEDELEEGNSSFVIRQREGEAVAFVSSQGEMYIKGLLYDGYEDFSEEQGFAIKNSNGEIVVLFDNEGNLMLKGDLEEEKYKDEEDNGNEKNGGGDNGDEKENEGDDDKEEENNGNNDKKKDE